MVQKSVDNLAEKIARVLREESGQESFSSLQSSIEKINERLGGIENKINSRTPSLELQTPNSFHPSQEKFDVIEALADEIIEHFEGEKICTFEPNGKTCDHCSMCNSRGF